MTPSWNRDSAVIFCGNCEGTGKVASHRQPSINDPYPEMDCDCGLGDHEPECPVCGFNQQLPGYDCLACETVAALYDADLRNLDVSKLAAAIGQARDVALAHQVAA